jgi:MFS family permease
MAHRRRHVYPGCRDRLIAAVHGFWPWAAGAVVLGAGTAMVYPTLLAAVGDVAHPAWRASAVGVYRLCRDAGFAAGALLAGVIADAFGLAAAVWAVAVITAASGAVVAARMYESHQRGGDGAAGSRTGPLAGAARPCAVTLGPPARGCGRSKAAGPA